MRAGALWAALLLAALMLVGCVSGADSASRDSLQDAGVPAERVDGIPAVRLDDAGTPLQAQEDTASQSSTLSGDAMLVRFIDVGQGDAALITLQGQTLLIDGGPSSASSKLYSILRDLGIDRIDYVIATHPDADHCGGLSGALNYASCSTFFCSVTNHDTKTFQSVLKYLGDTPVTVPACGQTFSLGDATVQFVGPVRNTGSADTNNGSLVCKLNYGDVSFLFTGDAEETSEYLMLSSGADLSADVLKVGHHGSASSSSASFLDAVSPRYSVISVGKNSYGHPTEQVMTRVRAIGSELLRTDELGTITFETDGSTLEYTTTKGLVTR